MLVEIPINITISSNESKSDARFDGVGEHLPSLHMHFIKPAHGGVDHAKWLWDWST